MATVQISGRLLMYLEELVRLEGFGDTVPEVVQRFVWGEVNRLIAAGRLGEAPNVVVPVPEGVAAGTHVTLVCEGCATRATLPRVGKEGEFLDAKPAIGWELYPRHLCPNCIEPLRENWKPA